MDQTCYVLACSKANWSVSVLQDFFREDFRLLSVVQQAMTVD